MSDTPFGPAGSNPNPSIDQGLRSPKAENVQINDGPTTRVPPSKVGDKLRLMARIWREGRDLNAVVPLNRGVAVTHETDKAALLELDDGYEMWVPKSQLCVVLSTSGEPTLGVALWLMKKKDALQSFWVINAPTARVPQQQCGETY